MQWCKEFQGPDKSSVSLHCWWDGHIPHLITLKLRGKCPHSIYPTEKHWLRTPFLLHMGINALNSKISSQTRMILLFFVVQYTPHPQDKLPQKFRSCVLPNPLPKLHQHSPVTWPGNYQVIKTYKYTLHQALFMLAQHATCFDLNWSSGVTYYSSKPWWNAVTALKHFTVALSWGYAW